MPWKWCMGGGKIGIMTLVRIVMSMSALNVVAQTNA